MALSYENDFISVGEFVEAFADNASPDMRKRAEYTAKSYVPMKMREEGVMRRGLLPPIQLQNSDLDRDVTDPRPCVIVDMEPNSPAAVSLPFGMTSAKVNMSAPRFRIGMDRIFGPHFVEDVDNLRTYNMDIRQILSDIAVKDMLAEEDGKFFAVANLILGAIGTPVTATGVIQYRMITGGLGRETLAEAKKILPSTPSNLEPATLVVNSVTAKELEKIGYDEWGGDGSEEIMMNGWTNQKILGLNVIVTIKRNLVLDNEGYLFAEPKFLGKFFVLTDATLHVERRAMMLSMFPFMTAGAAIMNVAAVSRVLWA